MPELTISQAAQRAGLRPSAIRYYERIGILPAARRVSGQRRYDSTVLYRLAVIQRARLTGFTLGEIKHLFFGFRGNMPASERWQHLSRRKLQQLEESLDRIRFMQRLLQRMQKRCQCVTLDECGKRIFERGKKLQTPLTGRFRLWKR